MPPAKGARATVGNDDRLDDTPIGRKLAQSSGPGRGRRPAASMNNIPAGKELSGPSGAVQTNGKHVPRVTRAQQSPWSSAPTSVLHSYRSSYRLNAQAAFNNPHAHEILESGIGIMSPTMAQPRNKRRVPKDQLALTVRKHFNSLPANENEVLVDLLYKVKTKEKSLRAKFPATKSR